MSGESDQDLVDRWIDQPAPLLGLLHAFNDRDGFVSEQAIQTISRALKIPLAELFGTVTFYHHLARDRSAADRPRVCTGPVCRHRGAADILQALTPDGAIPMPCAGRCDEPVPVIRGDRVLTGLTVETLAARPSPLPSPNPGGLDECVFESIREPGRAELTGYRRSGGYAALEHVAARMSSAELLDLIDDSGLAGRGGAGFPTGRKWRAVADAEGGPKTIVCNADEGEPGCFKDRVLMDHDPHAVIEGMRIAAYATGATRGFIYLRYEYPETFRVLERAISETAAVESPGEFPIYLRRGAGAYICGEETSLLNSLEGKHPFPRNRPPFPVTHGYENLPTVVNNVETLAAVAPIVRRGAAWYRTLGVGEHVGTKLISLSGDIERPGNYEVPMGLPLQTLLHEWAGGAPRGRRIQAVTMAGLSGGFLAGDALDATLDEPALRSRGSFLGAGGILVYDDSRDMVAEAHQAMEFFAEESCGKCFPCRIGTSRLTERLNGQAGPADLGAWREEVEEIASAMKATSACGLGMAAPLIVESLLAQFPDQVARKLKKS